MFDAPLPIIVLPVMIGPDRVAPLVPVNRGVRTTAGVGRAVQVGFMTVVIAAVFFDETGMKIVLPPRVTFWNFVGSRGIMLAEGGAAVGEGGITGVEVDMTGVVEGVMFVVATSFLVVTSGDKADELTTFPSLLILMTEPVSERTK